MSADDRTTAQSLATIMAMANDDLAGACVLVEDMSQDDLQRVVLFLARFAAVAAARDDDARRESLSRWRSTALRLSADRV